MTTRLSWTDVETIVRIADVDPDPEVKDAALEALAWLPLDEDTGRRVLGLLADEAPEAWRDTLDHHLWLLDQEARSARPADPLDRPHEAITALVLLPDHLFDDEDVVDVSALRGIPDVAARWLVTTLLRRLFGAAADDAGLEQAVSRIQRVIDVLPESARAEVVFEPAHVTERRALAGAALAVARPADVLTALLPWLRSHAAADRLEVLRALRAAGRFLSQPQLFGTSTVGPLDALGTLADLLGRTPGDAPALEETHPDPAPTAQEEPAELAPPVAEAPREPMPPDAEDPSDPAPAAEVPRAPAPLSAEAPREAPPLAAEAPQKPAPAAPEAPREAAPLAAEESSELAPAAPEPPAESPSAPSAPSEEQAVPYERGGFPEHGHDKGDPRPGPDQVPSADRSSMRKRRSLLGRRLRRGAERPAVPEQPSEPPEDEQRPPLPRRRPPASQGGSPTVEQPQRPPLPRRRRPSDAQSTPPRPAGQSATDGRRQDEEPAADGGVRDRP